MIIPEKYVKLREKDKRLDYAINQFPISFFGYLIRYPKQAEIIRQWLKVRPKVCIITGWKRTSKTSVAAFLGTCWLTGLLDQNWWGSKAMGIDRTYMWNRRFNGERVGIIGGSSFDHLENVLLPMYYSLIPPSRMKSRFSRQNKRIELGDNSKFIARTYDQKIDEWKSGNAQFVHLDEEPQLAVVNEILERTRTLEGKIFITVALDDADVSWLPDACINPKKYFGTDSVLHFKLGIEDVPDDLIPPTEKKALYVKFDETPLRNAVRKGEWVRLSGRWWKEFDAAIHVIQAFQIPKHWLKWRFMDAGTAAPTACAWVAMHPEGDIFVYREYYKSGTVIDERCRDVIELSGNRRQRNGDMWDEIQNNERYVETQIDYHEIKVDPVTGEGLDFHYLRAGLLVTPSTTLGQEARRDVVNRWMTVDHKKKHFITGKPGAPRIYIFDTCPNLIYEAQTKCLKREVNERASVSERKIEHRGDHMLDCVEYASVHLENWVNHEPVDED